MKLGFDSEKYLEEQSQYILQRVNAYDKLYLEFGGKLIGDFHAMRVLPGFDPDGKIKLLHRLRDQAEIIICVYAGDIEQNKIRGDLGITYDQDVLRLMDDLHYWDLKINSVLITRYTGQPAATQFKNSLERRGIKVYTHGYTEGYPMDVETIVRDAGDGANEHPTQALLDIFTIMQHREILNKIGADLSGLNISIIGDIDHSRVARSDIWAMQKLGANLTLFGPPQMMPRRADAFNCKIAQNIDEAVHKADVIIMLRIQLERMNGEVPFPSKGEYMKFFGLNKERIKLANNPIILHPGPINRGVELSSEVADSECSLVLNQVENGVAIRMAVLSVLNENRKNL